MGLLHLHIDGKVFRDSHNREVTLRGINVAGDAKYPKSPDLPSFVPDKFFDGDDVSFVGRPFSLEDAHGHFKRLRRWGYNTIRYIFTWEAIEHAGPGKYDEEWVTFTIEVLRIAKQYEFYVFMDPHQDVVSHSSRLFANGLYTYGTVVSIFRWLRCAYVVSLCCRIESERVQEDRGRSGPEYLRYTRRVPKDDMEYELY